ncbi:hypothetical protein LguiA_008918 [Lonicera macranthoides]
MPTLNKYSKTINAMVVRLMEVIIAKKNNVRRAKKCETYKTPNSLTKNRRSVNIYTRNIKSLLISNETKNITVKM